MRKICKIVMEKFYYGNIGQTVGGVTIFRENENGTTKKLYGNITKSSSNRLKKVVNFHND